MDQRFNALQNPNAAFQSQPITIDDVLNSRYINYPLHILESVMPTAGAIAFIVTTPERARALRQPPVYLLGTGVSQVLPVITLLQYVPEYSTVIFEQPEIHLHPLAQAGLAECPQSPRR